MNQFLAILITARMRTCPIWILHLVINIVNANAGYLSLSVFPCAIAHCVCILMFELTHVHSRWVVPAFGTVFIGTISVAWIERTGQSVVDDVASVWTLWVRFPLGPRQFFGFFWGYRPFPTAREKTRIFMRACVYVYMHIRMPACLSPCTCVCPHPCVYCGIVQYLRRVE